MKGFKILNNAFISVFTTGVSMSIFEEKYSKRAHIEETKRLQKIMAINFQIYGAHILEDDFVLYEALKHIIGFSDEGQPPVVEEIEIEGDIEQKKRDYVKNNIFDSDKIGINIIDATDLPPEILDIFKRVMKKRGFMAPDSPDSPKNA